MLLSELSVPGLSSPSRRHRIGRGGDSARAVAAKPTGHRLDEGISEEHRAMLQFGG